MPATQDRKDTREQILEAALALFRERGFAEATMREIAARAGVATGLAYYYFESKDAIVLAFYQRAREDLPALLEAAHSTGRWRRRLQAIVEAKFTYFAPNRRFLGALMATRPIRPARCRRSARRLATSASSSSRSSTAR